MAEAEEVIVALRMRAVPESLAGMKRFGIPEEGRLGVSVPVIRTLAKELGKNHALALELWDSGIAEARMLASMVAVPVELSEAEMDRWVNDFDAWDVCDQVCMNLFDKSPLAWKKIAEWSTREEEFVRRAALALIACLAWHDKQARDEVFEQALPYIATCAPDGRNYVKKAASWALRNIGKRNRNLYQQAIQFALTLQKMDSRSARWIAADALRELESKSVQEKFK